MQLIEVLDAKDRCGFTGGRGVSLTWKFNAILVLTMLFDCSLQSEIENVLEKKASRRAPEPCVTTHKERDEDELPQPIGPMVSQQKG